MIFRINNFSQKKHISLSLDKQEIGLVKSKYSFTRCDKLIRCIMVWGAGQFFFHKRINFMVKNIMGGVIYKLKKQTDRKFIVGRYLTSGIP